MNIRSLTLLIVAMLSTATAVADLRRLPDGRYDTMQGIFDDRFHTLTITSTAYPIPYSIPVATLGGNDRIVISFDELADDRSYLRYSLRHCNADWQPSALVESEYLDGFNEGTIDDWDYSRIAVTPYIHYTLAIPNEQTAPLISGNYLLQVYREDDPDSPLLQARFMLSEDTARVTADVTSVTDIDYNDKHQQVSVSVDVTNSQVEDPFNDLMVYVSQNSRLDNEVMVRHPLRIADKTALYEHLRPLIFDAGNEYRRFETVSVHYPGMGVESIDFFDPYYHATLAADLPRAGGSYIYDETQKGRYLVREYNSDRSDIEADYLVTHFTLAAPEMPGVTVYLDGDMVNRRLDDTSVMKYNHATGMYEKSLLLKQGAYNYRYLTIAPGDTQGRTATIEGDYHPTLNEYLVKVYHRRRGDRYDRLIGIARLGKQGSFSTSSKATSSIARLAVKFHTRNQHETNTNHHSIVNYHG